MNIRNNYKIIELVKGNDETGTPVEIYTLDNKNKKKRIYILKTFSDGSNLYPDDIDIRLRYAVSLDDILNYIEKWKECTVDIKMVEDKVVNAMMFPNMKINNLKNVAIYELCDSYGDEFYARYDEEQGAFIDCDYELIENTNVYAFENKE